MRQAIGDGIRLMVDANQSLTTAEAMRRGRAFQDLGCYWWEEPIPADDIEGYAALAEALDIPVATARTSIRRSISPASCSAARWTLSSPT